MRKVFGCFTSLLGIATTMAIVFFAFNGKYGTTQFITDISRFDGNMGLLSFSVVGLAILMLGLWLFFGGKKEAPKEVAPVAENAEKGSGDQ